MTTNFEILFMEEATEFLEQIPEKAREKLLYNLRKAQFVNDPKLFKKLNSDIWEFRSVTKKIQYRLFAFWDTKKNALVICTHGLIKKTQKTPKQEIEKAETLRKKYLQQYQ